MSRLKTIVQTGLGVSLAGFLATSTLADDKPDCIDPQTQMEMTFCAGVDYQEADAALNALWPDVLAAARLNDEYVGMPSAPGSGSATLNVNSKPTRSSAAPCSRWSEACVWRG
jgi:hypothetical protein